MRIEIVDDMGCPYVVTSRNLKVVGAWFADTVTALMSADARFNHPLRMDIWPQDIDESRLIGEYHSHTVTQDDLLSLAGSILQASQAMAEREAAQ